MAVAVRGQWRDRIVRHRRWHRPHRYRSLGDAGLRGWGLGLDVPVLLLGAHNLTFAALLLKRQALCLRDCCTG